MGKKNASVKIVCENRKARHDYFIHETYEAGIVLVGTEVKSLRAGKANLKDSFAKIKNNEIFLDNMHILMNRAIFSIMIHFVLENYLCIK